MAIRRHALNRTGSAFGINAGGSNDDPDGIDDDEGTESVTITFDQTVTFDQLVLTLFSSGEEASLTIAGGSPVSLTDTGSGTDEFNFTTNNTVLVGEEVIFSHVSGNDFSFDNFTANTQTSPAVPEPAAIVMWFVGLAGLAVVCRRRSRRS